MDPNCHVFPGSWVACESVDPAETAMSAGQGWTVPVGMDDGFPIMAEEEWQQLSPSSSSLRVMPTPRQQQYTINPFRQTYYNNSESIEGFHGIDAIHLPSQFPTTTPLEVAANLDMMPVMSLDHWQWQTYYGYTDSTDMASGYRNQGGFF